MTRRERLLRIIESFGMNDIRVRRTIESMTYRNLDAFTDDAIEDLTARVWSDHKRTQRMNAENRRRYAEQASKGAA